MKLVKTWTRFLIHNDSKIIKSVKRWIYEHCFPAQHTALCRVVISNWFLALGLMAVNMTLLHFVGVSTDAHAF